MTGVKGGLVYSKLPALARQFPLEVALIVMETAEAVAAEAQRSMRLPKTGVLYRVSKTGKPSELAIAERRGIAEPYTVTLPHNSTAAAGDQVRALSRVFHVADVLRGSWDTAARAICEEVK